MNCECYCTYCGKKAPVAAIDHFGEGILTEIRLCKECRNSMAKRIWIAEELLESYPKIFSILERRVMRGGYGQM